MESIYNKFVNLLELEDKENAVNLILSLLEEKKIDIVSLYTDIVAPSLNNMKCDTEQGGVCIWKEHVRSSIIRTIIECCYPYVIKEKNKIYKGKNYGKVVVICPVEEHHEIGARIISDFFTLCGFETIFVGSNTPKNEFLKVIDYVNPKYLAISVTSYYNLVAAKATIEKIRKSSNKKLNILVGGHAFRNNPLAFKNSNADMVINNFDDIKKLQKENQNEITI
ncbi:cobalamin-dependent protein [Clostridium bowmanii]|uniref:cobalamin B12-binding domain-containing protein n=1 Tax=Clostridium bowmanii TaxID=132925 RepID=UPI001C0D818D|nr:cobalamin-dependent protein [Clostridium bowmanii]MBU3190508.1 cobalamin-dependent protein [Clostridium bowmanii]MCA1074430.1 cobalamin-dependent protein [Clostridium bowmanii]